MRGPAWYAVATKHRQSHAALLAIEELGFRCFLPWVSFPLPKGARELRPMFGPYLFAYFDAASDSWGAITRLPCVPDRPVLAMADPMRPTPISQRMIDRIYADLGRRYEDIARRMSRGERLVVEDPVGVLVSVGAEVRIAKGWHEGRTGVVDAVRRGGREARVALEGFALPLWVPNDRLELLGDAA